MDEKHYRSGGRLDGGRCEGSSLASTSFDEIVSLLSVTYPLYLGITAAAAVLSIRAVSVLRAGTSCDVLAELSAESCSAVRLLDRHLASINSVLTPRTSQPRAGRAQHALLLETTSSHQTIPLVLQNWRHVSHERKQR